MKTTTPTENPNNPENIAADMRAAPSAGPFLPFVPLKPSADSLPSFPVECLPPKLRTYVEAVAVHTQTPVDMAAGVALGVLATCLQGTVKVEGNIGHYEQTSLYVFLVAPPGSRKSAVIQAMTAAIEDYEQQYNEQHQAAMRRNRQERESLQRDINRLTKVLESKYDKMTELELQHAQDIARQLGRIRNTFLCSLFQISQNASPAVLHRCCIRDLGRHHVRPNVAVGFHGSSFIQWMRLCLLLHQTSRKLQHLVHHSHTGTIGSINILCNLFSQNCKVIVLQQFVEHFHVQAAAQHLFRRAFR